VQIDKKTSVLVIHEDTIVAAGIAALLGTEFGMTICGDCNLCDANFSCEPSIDILITDYDTGVKLAKKFRGLTRIPESAPRILIVTSYSREWEVHSALNIGVHGYLLQNCSAAELLLATSTLSRGANYVCLAVSQSVICSLSREALTARETDVLALLANGACNRSIADTLGITINTTKAHVKSILEKLNAESRTEAAAIATRRGLVRETANLDATPSSGLQMTGNAQMPLHRPRNHQTVQVVPAA
jgi:DNA-binding NarL/FixJ family response regulator